MRERRTGQLVRACYAKYVKGRSPRAELLHALCRVTWITKYRGEVTDNTRSVIAPALSVLVGEELDATTPAELSALLKKLKVPDVIWKTASREVGFVNFYAAFRNSCLEWLKVNRLAVAEVAGSVFGAERDPEVHNAYAIVGRLPRLPRKNAGNLPAFNLLTPVLACLDHRERAPIINSRAEVRRRLRRLNLANGALVEQFEGLKGLIGQGGIDGAFALDTASDEQFETAFLKKRTRSFANVAGKTKPLGERNDRDAEYLRRTDAVKMRHRHNKMTNALVGICKDLGLDIEEGWDHMCFFDARILNYIDTGRHLLIEVKTETSPAFLRLAVGQLLDYRRHLTDRAATDLAVLMPRRPSEDMGRFLGDVRVKVMWFVRGLKRLGGDVNLGAGHRGRLG